MARPIAAILFILLTTNYFVSCVLQHDVRKPRTLVCHTKPGLLAQAVLLGRN